VYPATSTYDLMSYCDNSWISPYTYEAIRDYRLTATDAAASLWSNEPAGAQLLVWGQIRPDGSVLLEAPFAVNTRPAQPRRGAYRLEGTDVDGQVLFSVSFAGKEVIHGAAGERHFAFTVPAGPQLDRLARIRVLRTDGRSAAEHRPLREALPGGRERVLAVSAVGAGDERFEWDTSVFRAMMVRDATTGNVLAISRTGTVTVSTAGNRIQVILSDGVRSVRRELNPTDRRSECSRNADGREVCRVF
jgi:hypothetical protein